MSRITAVLATIVALVVPFVISPHASASTGQRCGFVLLSDRFDAQDALIDGQTQFVKDVNGFNSTIFGADSVSEIFSDYNQSVGDLNQDLRFSTGDIQTARGDALSEFRDGACTGASQARLDKELAFYADVQHQLNVAYRKARALLHKNLLAAIALCC